jgi:hypothetical protein
MVEINHHACNRNIETYNKLIVILNSRLITNDKMSDLEVPETHVLAVASHVGASITGTI